jgi:hypothetical protein
VGLKRYGVYVFLKKIARRAGKTTNAPNVVEASTIEISMPK